MKAENYTLISSYFDEHPLFKSDESGKMQPDKGVQQSYKDAAHSGANIMFRAKIKGEKHLDKDIPLHMTLKTFDKPEKMPIDEIKSKAEELNIQRPDPKSLKYEPITFKSPKNGNTYYMLKVTGTHPSLEKFSDHFKGQGITHDKFMAHVTINKDLYDKIKKEGIGHHEVEFSPLLIEHGAGNLTHLFQDDQSHTDPESDLIPKYKDPNKMAASEQFDGEPLEKGAFKNAAIKLGTALAVATAGSPAHTSIEPIDHTPKNTHVAEPNPPKPIYDHKQMLRAIASVESNNGKDTRHKVISGTMNAGSSAYGKYGLTPIVIKETIKMNKDLKTKYAKAVNLKGDDLKHFMQDNPHLEDQIAEKHLSRLEHHFGNKPAELGYAWLNGITGTYKAKKDKVNIDDHWHVRKINEAYSKSKG